MLLQMFINQTRNLISRSDIKIHFPEIITVEIQADGTPTHLMELSSHFNSAQINQNFMLNVVMFFGMLDAYVDSSYPALIGKSYAEKLRLLPNTTDSEIVLNEVFRIYKLIRNATIHNSTSITTKSNNNIYIQYLFRSTQHELEISPRGLSLLHSISYEFISPFEPRNATYSNAFRVSLLTELRAEIVIFNDENGNLGPLVPNNYSFKNGRRYRLHSVSVQLQDQKLIIQNPYSVDPQQVSFAGVDYRITINGKDYLVPSEALDNSYIPLDQLSTWELI